jgi:hypothetical protein
MKFDIARPSSLSIIVIFCLFAGACSDDANQPIDYPDVDGLWNLYMMPTASTDTLFGYLNIMQEGEKISCGVSIPQSAATLEGSISGEGRFSASISNERGSMTINGHTTEREDSLAGEFTIGSETGGTYFGEFYAIFVLR